MAKSKSWKITPSPEDIQTVMTMAGEMKIIPSIVKQGPDAPGPARWP